MDKCRSPDTTLEKHPRHGELLALAILTEDFAPQAISRFAGVSVAQAVDALAWGTANGIVVDGTVAAETAASIVNGMGPAWLADAHRRVAHRLLVDGWERVADVVRHARAAGSLGPIPDLVGLLDRAARASLSVSDYDTARTLLETADEFDDADEFTQRSWRLCRLAEAWDGLGRVEQARDVAVRAFELAEIAGDADLGLEAAVLSAFPADWCAGDLRTSAVIRRAEELAQHEHHRVALLGARAVAEMRIPVCVNDRQQVAWVTRASVAQPLAAEALVRSERCGPSERLVALMAWRTCHRAPRHLEQRRRSSLEALDLSQQLRRPTRQVEAAIMLGADAIESGDRTLFDHALSVARWVAERDGNPRLLAHTRAMEAGAAFADGEIETAQRLHREAVGFATSVDLSSRFSLDAVLQAQYYTFSGEGPPRGLMPQGDDPVLAHPLAQVATAVAWARLGEMNEAETLVRHGLRRLDEESSMLLMLVLAAEAVILLRSDELSERLVELLTPWSAHVAIDSNTWWHGGPVAAALAELSAARGDSAAARHAADARRIAMAMGDARTMRRMEQIRASASTPGAATPLDVHAALSARQMRVLELVAAGLTNREIASQLSYSPSTVKSEVATLFKVLGVTNRAQVIRYVAQNQLGTTSAPPTHE